MFHQSMPSDISKDRRQPSLCLLLAAALLLAGLLFIAPAAAYAGSGTQEDPYRIITESDLRQLSDDTNSGNKFYNTHFRLEEDIRLTSLFTPIGYGNGKSFEGHFDGAGHTISNLTIDLNGTGKYPTAGLFGSANEIANLGVYAENITFITDQYGGSVGTLAGSVSNVHNCYAVVSGSVTIDSPANNGPLYVGGLVGGVFSGSSIANSYAVVSGSVIGNRSLMTRAGGLAGYFSGSSFSNNYVVVNGSVTGRDAGGLVGSAGKATSQNSVALVSTVNGAGPTESIPGSAGHITGSGGITVNCYAWDQMTNASGSSGFRIDEYYAPVTSEDALKFSWWTEKAAFNPDIWTTTSYYALPSHKTLPAPALPEISIITDTPPWRPPSHISLSSSVTLDPLTDPLVQMFQTSTQPLSPKLKYSVTNRESTAVSSVSMTSEGNNKYSGVITGMTPKTTYYWWATAYPYPFSRPGTPFTTPDFTLGTPASSSVTATSATITVTLSGPDVSADTYPSIYYGTENDILKAGFASAAILPGSAPGLYTAVLSGLTPGTTYYYWAGYWGCTTPDSGSFTTPAVTGDTPVITTGSTMATVTFETTVPSGSTYNDLPAASVLFGTSPDSSAASVVAASPVSVTGTTATYKTVITGLTPGTEYHFRSKIGTGPVSNVQTATTSTFTLGTPTAGTPTATGAKITVTLTNPIDSVPPVILYSTGSDPDLAKSLISIRNGTTDTYSANLDGLLPGTTYTYWAQYSGQTNKGAAPFTTDTAAVTLGTPALVASGPGSVTIAFTATVPAGTALADPGILYGTDPDSDNNKNIAAATLTGTSGTTATYQATITGLDQNRDYHFRATGSGLRSPGSLTASPSLYTLADLAISGDPGTTTARITFTLANVSSGAAPTLLYGTDSAVGSAVSIPAVRTTESGTAYHANLDGLTPKTPYYIWAEYNGHTIGGTQLLTTAATADATISVTAARNTPTSASFSITTEHGDGTAPTLTYYPEGTPAQAKTLTASGGPSDWTVYITDLLADTAYNYSANYNRITTSEQTLAKTQYSLTITTPADDTTTVSSLAPLLIWTISGIETGITAIDPVITLTGTDTGKGTISGTTRTAVSDSAWTYQTALTDLAPGKTYTATISYGGASVSRTFKTPALTDPVLRVTASRTSATTASFSITTEHGDGTAPTLTYYPEGTPAQAKTLTASGGPSDWTVYITDLLAGTAYNYSANYSGITASGALPSLSPHITITSPADSATGISTSPLIIWTISDIDLNTTPSPVITLQGGAGEIIGTTNTGESGSTRTYQTALRGLLPGTPFTIKIEYGGTAASVSFTTAASPSPVTLNPPVLMTGTLTETAASFLIKLDNITDNPGAVFLYYNTQEDPGNATAIAATPGTTTGTTRGYYAGLDHLAPGTLYYIWSWIDGTAPVPGTPFTTEGGTSDVTISGASDKILLGTTARLTANRDVIWTSSNPAALEIDSETGEYTAKKVTTRPVTITAAPYGATGTSDTVRLTITDPAPSADNTRPGSGWNSQTPAQITYTLDDSYAVIRLPALTRGKETVILTDITITSLTEGIDYRIENGNILLQTPGTGTNQLTITATGRKLGDTDRDGTITSADALRIAQYIAETRDLDREDRPYADVLPISGISVQDALAILEMNVGYRNPDYTLL